MLSQSNFKQECLAK